MTAEQIVGCVLACGGREVVIDKIATTKNRTGVQAWFNSEFDAENFVVYAQDMGIENYITRDESFVMVWL